MQNVISIRASDRRHRPKRGRHRHDHYEILIIKSGTGTHWIDFKCYDIRPNQLFFLRPGQMHQFLPNNDAVFYFIAFDKHEVMLNAPTNLQSFEFFQSFHCDAPVEIDEVDSIIKQMVDIQYELAHPGMMQDVLMSGLLTVLLIKIQRKFRLQYAMNQGAENDIVTQFNRMIDCQNQWYRFVKDYAQALHVSSTYLNDTVRLATGHSARYWVDKKVILLAKQMIQNPSQNIKTIATRLGFTDPTHFGRFFKSHTSFTPKQYRASTHE